MESTLKKNPIKQVTKIFQEVERDKTKATVSALNRSGKSALSHAQREFRKHYNVKLKDLKAITSIVKANKNRQQVTVRFINKSLGLEYFNATKRKKGYAANVKKGARKVYTGSFTIKVNASGHESIFKREGKSRLPIERIFGANPAKIMTTEQSVDKMSIDFFEIYKKEFTKALEYYLK